MIFQSELSRNMAGRIRWRLAATFAQHVQPRLKDALSLCMPVKEWTN